MSSVHPNFSARDSDGSFAAGMRLGPYEIVAKIGEGGMGSVYRAIATRLQRTVAIKVLAPNLTESTEAKIRLEREARAISQLQHPHVCVLFDVGQHGGADFLVMEYLEGDTLSERLIRGPLPLEQTLRFAIEIADALDQAHRVGIVHRDLKPGNIMLTKSGPKLMDFGLAKPMGPIASGAHAAGHLTPSTPTLTLAALSSPASPLTQQGTVVGTFRYIAPELLQGAEADVRSDIFAFGCVLYEMLAGKPAFAGKTQASVIASILALDPAPISTLQPLVPPIVDQVIANCLAKEPGERVQSAHDLMLQLRMSAVTPNQRDRNKAQRLSPRSMAWVLSAFVAAALIALATTWFRSSNQSQYSTHSYILPPQNAEFRFSNTGGQIALSPDGRYLAYTAHGPKQPEMLWIQSLNSSAPQSLPGTDGASFPFWAPDSRHLGFFSAGALKKIDLKGGPPQTICEAPRARGGTWNRYGTIVFSSTILAGLTSVRDSGGTTQEVTQLSTADRENSHRWPQFLPDGEHFLYFARSDEPNSSGIYVGALGSKERRLVMHSAWPGIYASGYLLFLRDGTLMAQPFNLGKFAVVDNATPLAEQVTSNDPSVYAVFSVSENGVLVLHSAGGTSGFGSQLMSFDRTGKAGVVFVAGTGLFPDPMLSPDGSRLAFSLFESRGSRADIWVLDLKRQTRTRITFGPRREENPIWTPDGHYIYYSSVRVPGGLPHIYRKAADGTGAEETILDSGTAAQEIPTSISSDGRYLVYNRSENGFRVWVMPLFGERKPFSISDSNTPFAEQDGRVSPDGRWIAYSSIESGSTQVYLKRFPSGSGKWQVTTAAGFSPMWRPDGEELFFIDPDGNLTALDFVAQNGVPQLGAPHALFRIAPVSFGNTAFAVFRGGKQFIANSVSEAGTGRPLTLIVNWTADLKK